MNTGGPDSTQYEKTGVVTKLEKTSTKNNTYVCKTDAKLRCYYYVSF